MSAHDGAEARIGGRLPDGAYGAGPWRIRDLTADFDLEDVWELPGEGSKEDFPRLLEMICTMDPERGGASLSRVLWAVRWKLGGLLGWDDEDDGLGTRVASLRDRLPEDLQHTDPPRFALLPFSSLYVTDNEFAAEIANGTMHGVMHLGWVPDPAGSDRCRAQMTVLVKPNGWAGKAYMMAIRPFRHLIVYPAMMRQGRALWDRMEKAAA
jgi:hypothetical protein